jgi:hypothetical protein
LNYAAKDADDFATALEIAAEGHEGLAAVNVRRLTDNSETPATRRHLQEGFEWLQGAKSTDIMVIYMAGHGITWGGAEGDYYYLLREAASLEIEDEVVRKQAAISSLELTEWIKRVPATKQVLILDTCASGQLIAGLTASRRSVSSSQARSLERMKDRTGMFVLAGSAADSVSYEATAYGQGLLTYSLLEGMKGAALRDGEFVDVQTLFGHAVDRVPQLAGEIGGIQQPRLAIPAGGESFDVGHLQEEARRRIPLAQPRPLVLRAAMQDVESFRDTLKLGDAVNEVLRHASRGPEAPLVFIDAAEFSEAYLLAGRYSLEGDLVQLEVAVSLDDQDLGTINIEGRRSALGQLAAGVVEQAKKLISRNFDG